MRVGRGCASVQVALGKSLTATTEGAVLAAIIVLLGTLAFGGPPTKFQWVAHVETSQDVLGTLSPGTALHVY